VAGTAEQKATLVRLGRYAGAGIALLLVVLLLTLAYRNGFAALDEARDYRRQVGEAAARQAARHQHMAELLNRADGAAAILAPGSEGEAQASLQRHLSAALRAASAELASLEVLPTSAEQGYRRISLHADLRVDISGLQKLLHNLEFGLPLIAVERLRVRALGSRSIGSDRRLSVDLDVVALQQRASP